MAQIQYIKDQYENEEVSLREISRKTGHCFETVRKYAYQEDWREDDLPNIEPQSYPVLESFIPTIDEWLEADRKIPRKQRHTAKRIFDRLQDEKEYTGSYSSVRRYVQKKKYVLKAKANGYLPLAHLLGSGQVDFGESMGYDTSGQEITFYGLTISFPNSNKGYTQIFPSQNQECLLEGMKRIFEHIGGVPPMLRFDNMSTAVAQIQQDGERVLTEGFRRFMLHYRFRAEFCNPASGNEKGNVENKVGYSRRNLFVPVPTITSFDTYNETLWNLCEKDAEREHYKHKVPIRELWKEDEKHLLTLPEHSYTVFRYETLTVSNTGFVAVDKNKYGLSPQLSKQLVQAKIFYDHVEFFHDHRPVGTFHRSYKDGEEVFDWTQYLTTLCVKPGAAPHTRFFQEMPQQWREYLSHTQGKERKSALQLLKEIVEDGNVALCDEALELATSNGRTDADSLRQFYYLIARKENRPDPLRLSSGPAINYNPSLTVYDRLTGGVANAGVN